MPCGALSRTTKEYAAAFPSVPCEPSGSGIQRFSCGSDASWGRSLPARGVDRLQLSTARTRLPRWSLLNDRQVARQPRGALAVRTRPGNARNRSALPPPVGRRLAGARFSRNQTLKDDPQPQLPETFGLPNLKPEP
ncbi:MAG: hypothetical protein RL033_7640 [Pseudomonadota bacterium]